MQSYSICNPGPTWLETSKWNGQFFCDYKKNTTERSSIISALWCPWCLMAPFRQTAKRFFLTFPQCQISKEVVAAQAQKKWGTDLEWIVVAEEKHKDGSPHLHCALSFGVKKNFKFPGWADFLTGKHGDYKVMNGMKKVLTYVTKDGDFLEVGIVVASVLANKSSKMAMVEAEMQDGAPLADIVKSHPGFVINHLKKMEYFQAYLERTKIQTKEICWDPVRAIVPPGQDIAPEATLEIVRWLNLNIRKERSFKQKQLWIWGGPNLGKSSLAEQLSTLLRVYFLPLDEVFYGGYEDGTFDLIVADEMLNQKPIGWMNLFLQGSSMNIAVKGSQRTKCSNPPVMILSNFTPEQAYASSPILSVSAFLTRLTVVEVTEFIKIESQYLSCVAHSHGGAKACNTG